MAKLEGVDLVTEGVVTLGQTVELLRRADSVHDLPGLIDEYGDGAPVRLASILLQADEVELMVGMAINPAQVADLLRGEPMRMIYIRELLPELERRNKRTTVRYV